MGAFNSPKGMDMHANLRFHCLCMYISEGFLSQDTTTVDSPNLDFAYLY